MQVSNRHNQPGRIMYGRGARNVVKNLLNPHWSISVNGFWDFLSREVIPISINSGQAQYWPNYMNHLMGGGMSYRMMQEYFPLPRSRATPTAWAGADHLRLPLPERSGREQRSPRAHDRPGGRFLDLQSGRHHPVQQRQAWPAFSARTLHMADWSYQPVWSARQRRTGQQRPELRRQVPPEPARQHAACSTTGAPTPNWA